jgi:hypothetical protein
MDDHWRAVNVGQRLVRQPSRREPRRDHDQGVWRICVVNHRFSLILRRYDAGFRVIRRRVPGYGPNAGLGVLTRRALDICRSA